MACIGSASTTANGVTRIATIAGVYSDKERPPAADYRTTTSRRS